MSLTVGELEFELILLSRDKFREISDDIYNKFGVRLRNINGRIAGIYFDHSIGKFRMVPFADVNSNIFEYLRNKIQ